MDSIFYFMQASPFGRSNAAIHRFAPVKSRITFWNEIAMKIGNIALVIRIDCVIGRIGTQLHYAIKILVIFGFGAPVRLHKGF